MSQFKKLPSEQELVDRVAENWRYQYFNGGKWRTTIRGSSEETYKQLQQAKTPQDVRDLGLENWIMHWCNECGQQSGDAYQLGEDPDYESRTVVLCRSCAVAFANFVLSDGPPVKEQA